MNTPSGPRRTLYTVGHSNLDLLDFIELLGVHQISVLVDVRSRPRSAWVPHFNRESLAPAAERAGIEYQWSPQLGGRPDSDEFYTPSGHVRYDRLAASPPFQAALATLLETASHSRVAVMCAEKSPAQCHRRLLVARAVAKDFSTVHILDRNSPAPDSDFADPQGSLFVDTEWLSANPVTR